MIEQYTLLQWLAFFFVYCFLGWVIESTIVSVSKRKLVNRGFLRGPVLPLYGFGALIMLLTTIALKTNIVLVYICGTFAATILEYLTGVIMEALLKIKYWDYSDKRFNFHGYICLTSSLFWGLLSVFLLYVIHPFVSGRVTETDQDILLILVCLICIVFAVDCTASLRKNFSLKKLLSYQTKVRQEITELTVKISSIRSERLIVSAENDAVKKTGPASYIKDIGMRDMEEGIKRLEAYRDKLKTELENAKEKAVALKTTLRSFPSATSKKFNDALQDLKMKFK